jgi:hypothetical protein
MSPRRKSDPEPSDVQVVTKPASKPTPAVTARRYAHAWQEPFLDALSRNGIVTNACKVVNIGNRTAYDERHRNAAFAKKWEDAVRSSGDSAEAEAWRRAVLGWDEPVFQGGKQVGIVRKHSDTLLLAVLKARKPDEYGDRIKVDVTEAARRIAKQRGATPEEEEAAVAEAEAILRRQREEFRRRV